MKNTNTSKENAVQLKPRKVAVRPKFTVTGLEPDEKTAKQWEKGAFDRMAIIETLKTAGKPMDAYEIDEALKLDGRLVSQSGYLKLMAKQGYLLQEDVPTQPKRAAAQAA